MLMRQAILLPHMMRQQHISVRRGGCRHIQNLPSLSLTVTGEGQHAMEWQEFL